MRKQVGNIEVEVHEAMNCADPYVVYLSVRTSTVKQLNLTASDARDLVYALQCALGQGPTQETRTEAAPEPPEATWICDCGRSNYVTVTRCEGCELRRNPERLALNR